MKTQEIKKLISSKVIEVSQKEIANIDSTIKNLITRSICSLLGISDRGEIDHCNGRNSILTDIIKSKAEEQVERLVSTFKFDSNDKEVLEAFKKEFRMQLDRRIQWHAEELAKEIASKTIKKFTDKELIKIGFTTDEEIKPEVRF